MFKMVFKKILLALKQFHEQIVKSKFLIFSDKFLNTKNSEFIFQD